MRQAAPGEDRPGKRPQPGRIRAIVLAVLVHAAFFALIVFGVSWQNQPSPPVVADLWDSLPPVKKAPPRPQPPKPEPPEPEPPRPKRGHLKLV